MHGQAEADRTRRDARALDEWPEVVLLVGCGVPLAHVARDASALGYDDPLAPGPLAHGLRVTAPGGGPSGATRRAATSGGVLEIGRYRLVECSGFFCRQVDAVVVASISELDCLAFAVGDFLSRQITD